MIEVVVVDDDFRIAELHTAAVEEVSGFHVIATANTAQAGAAAESTSGSPTVHRSLEGPAEAGDWVSAAEIAEQVGVSPSTTRYLSRLVDTGKVELSLQYGVAGRPANLYRRAGRNGVAS